VQIQGSKQLKAEFQYSVENLRGLAIILVLLSHITSFENLGGFGSYLLYFFRDATTWFVFISGYLFYFTERHKFNYRIYLWKKLKFVISPYLILSVPAICIGIYLNRDIYMGLSPLAYGLWSLVVGGSVVGPMWFIPMIAIFFIVSPLFFRLGGSRVQYMVLMCGLVFSLFSTRPFKNLNPFLSFAHFFGFYILGVVVSFNLERIRRIAGEKSGLVLMFGTFLIFIFSSILHIYGDQPDPVGFQEGLGRFNNAQLGKLALLALAFLLFSRFLNVRNRILAWLAEISFGLFFMQGFFMAIFGQLSYRVTFSHPLMMLLAELSILLGGSVLAVLIIKRITGRWSRYVIGC
jgi:hypothetical protein